jgi:hypothetical protein
MRKRLLLLPLLAASALTACSVRDSTVSAYTSEDLTVSPLDGTCASVADTGDMYHYCMQYGPQLALAPERN